MSAVKVTFSLFRADFHTIDLSEVICFLVIHKPQHRPVPIRVHTGSMQELPLTHPDLNKRERCCCNGTSEDPEYMEGPRAEHFLWYSHTH